MIVYFADRTMNVVGHASDKLGNSYRIANDSCVTEIEHGTETLTFDLYFQPTTRLHVQEISKAGNYILRHTGEKDSYKLYTIIDREINVNDRRINIYAEDGGLDLLNETAGPFDPSSAQTINYYINKYLQDTGFTIGKNEIGTSTKKYLVFEQDETVTKRLLSIAESFGGELTYSYTINGLKVTAKKVDIYKRIGSDKAIELRTDREVDNIVVKETIENLCTGIYPMGSSPEGTVGYVSGKNELGATTYTWLRFADSVNGEDGFENAVGSHNFMGVALNQTKYLESEDPKKYVWYRVLYNSVIIVPDEENIRYGILERKGGDGSDAWDSSDRYTWIRFADDEYGTNMSSSSSGKKFIGISTRNDSSTPSNKPEDYDWDQYVGPETTNLYLRPSSYELADERFCFWKYADNSDGSGTLYNNARRHPYVGFLCKYENYQPTLAEEYVWGKVIDCSYDGTYATFEWCVCGLREYKADNTTPTGKYLWARFAKDEEATEVLTSPKGARFIGLSYGNERVNPTNSRGVYKWYDITGDNDRITLVGYSYDKGDIYVSEDGIVYSRKGIDKWTRYKSPQETGRTDKGAIVRRISYQEGNPDELFNLAVKDLEKYSDAEVTYDVSLKYLPENVFIGDRINIVDDAGEIYVSARLLKIERSECNDTVKATFGDFVKKTSGINSDVEKLAQSFAELRKKQIEAEQVITVSISSSEGISFKNNNIETVLTATVKKGNNKFEIPQDGYILRWMKNGEEVEIGRNKLTLNVSSEEAIEKYSVQLETVEDDI